jgi:hypothetical protein
MTKAFATAIAAATLLAASLAATPGNAQDSRSARQDLSLAQGYDIQIGRGRDDGYRHRRYDSDATVDIGPGRRYYWASQARKLPHGHDDDRARRRPRRHAPNASL